MPDNSQIFKLGVGKLCKEFLNHQSHNFQPGIFEVYVFPQPDCMLIIFLQFKPIKKILKFILAVEEGIVISIYLD
jgi:hypothetical protein